MKNLIALVLTLLPFMAFTQTLPVNKETEKVEYTAIIDEKGTKEELFSAAKHWVMTTFSAPEEIILEEDEEEGHLVIRGLSLIDYVIPSKNSSTEIPMHFTLTVDVQNNQYRYVFTDVYFKLVQEDTSLIIPIEETLLGKAEKRILLSERVTSAGLELTTEEFQEELKITHQQYDQFQSKGNGTIIGISDLLKQGMRLSE